MNASGRQTSIGDIKIYLLFVPFVLLTKISRRAQNADLHIIIAI